jgi:carbon-monoxide dehydrogenase large subunit
VALARFTGADDFGRIVNPMIVEGQVHGALVQGIGQALYESAIYDPESGQLMTGSFMDYCMPRADNFIPFALETNTTLCAHNPLGAKGCGEAGTIGAPPAIMNAVLDALAPLGVTALDMPATPERVLRAMAQPRQA